MRFFVVIIQIFLTGVVVNNKALSSCGAATCPLNNYHAMRSGWLNLSFTHEYINQDRLFLGSSESFVGAIPEHHDEIQTINVRDVFQVGYGISDRLAFQLSLPFVHREHSHISHESSVPAYQAWNFSGLGDMAISGQLTLLSAEAEFDPYLSFSLGVKLATGVTDFRNTEGELAEVTIQPGTGSTDVIAGLHYRQTVLSVPTFSGQYSALPLIVGLLYQTNGRGTDDYRFGNSLLVHVGTAYQFVSRAGFLFQMNGKFQDYADVGNTDEPRENTGGTWVYASPGAQVQLADELFVNAYLQFPVYENVHGLQQASKFNLQFGVSFGTNLLGN